MSKGWNHGAIISQRRASALKTATRRAWSEDQYEASIAADNEAARAEAAKRAEAIWND